MGAPTGDSAHGITAAPAEVLGAPSPWPFDLFQEAEPNLQEIGALLARTPFGFPDDLVRLRPHSRKNSPRWLTTGCRARRTRVPAYRWTF